MRFISGVGLALLALASTSASASEVFVYAHNGSIVELALRGDRATIAYVRPRHDLARAGVRPGAVLFEGTYRENRFAGRAHVFRAGCPPRGYDVVGRHAGNRILLGGPAPLWGRGCSIRRYSVAAPPSNLAFEYRSTRY